MKGKRPMREYQDSVFRMLFRDKESAIEDSVKLEQLYAEFGLE